MTYVKCKISRRLLPVVTTFVLISLFLISGKLVRARPQENLVATSAPSTNSDNGILSSNEIKELVTERPELVTVTVENDRNGDSFEASTRPVHPSSDTLKPVTGSPIRFYAEYSVNSGLDFGRAAAESSTKSATTANTLTRSVTKQLMSVNASDMVSTDTRTPPKIKSQIVHSHQHQSLHTPGKGEAIPVVLDGNEEAALEKLSSGDNFKYTHSDATPSSGLSTWVLLNSDTVSTPYSHKKVHKPVLYDVSNLTSSSAENTTDATKKKHRPAQLLASATVSTTENILKTKIDAANAAIKKPDRKPVATIQKLNQTHVKKPPSSSPKIDPDMTIVQTTPISPSSVTPLQDSKFKNKTPVIVGKVPTSNIKFELNTTTPMTFIQSPIDNGTRLGTPVVTFPHVPVRQRPGAVSSGSPSRKPIASSTRPTLQVISSNGGQQPARISSSPVEFSVVPITSAVTTEISSAVTMGETTAAAAEISTESSSVTKKTTDSTSSKKKKKKKKKKNKRKSSTPRPGQVQSKISEDDGGNNTIALSKLPNAGLNPNRPLSTRIYNYLAREVMPNMGVGIVGLVLTAGLAGLLLYPFGAAVPIRRNYLEGKPNHNHPSYNLNDYSPVGEVDNAQPEESVLSKVLAGMSNTMNQYSREQPDPVYKNPHRFKPHRFDNPPNSYPPLPHHKEAKFTTEKASSSDDNIIKYSELGDVVSGPHESVKFTQFDINDSIKYPPPPMEGSQPSASYSTIDMTANPQNEPLPYHKYRPSEGDDVAAAAAKQDVYSTLGEYSSFNNPDELVQSPVYNGETYDYKNHKQEENMKEFKVTSELEVATPLTDNQTSVTSSSTPKTSKQQHHEQPAFAALEGIPKHYRTLQTSIRFEEPASVLPMNEDFVPIDGGVSASSVEHGPRSMRLRRRRRKRRSVLINSENELDSVLLDSNAPAAVPVDSNSTTPSAVQFITTTAAAAAAAAAAMTSSESNEKMMSTVTAVSSTSDEMFNEIYEEVNLQTAPTVLPQANSTNFTTEGSKKNTNLTHNQAVECENCELSNVDESSPPAPQQTFFLTSLFRKILHFKLRLGLELIRATSEAIGRYLGNVQAKMSEALRNIQRSAFQTDSPDDRNNKKIIKRRDKRHINFIFT